MDIFKPFEILADFVTYDLLNLTLDSYIAEAVHFFVYDIFKIGFLLVVINYVMAMTRYYFPIEKLKDMLIKRNWYGLDYLFAAILGLITPFCSCSSIPLFIGFLQARIPLGVTFAFLIASPLINESSLILFPALFGAKTTIIYNLIGMGVSIIGGLMIQKLKLEKYVNQDLLKLKTNNSFYNQKSEIPLKKLLVNFWDDGFSITKTIFPYVVLGVSLGALIHGFVPAKFIENSLNSNSFFAVPIATLLGIPLYANSVSVIPIIEAFVNKGIPVGTALAFMTATVTLSIPEALILKKVMNWKLLAIFFGITTIGIMLIGFILNILI